MRKGFTLMELLIVVIIIGVLAALGLPNFLSSVEKGRAAEAKQLLGAIRSAQLRYYAEHALYATTMTDLDVDNTVLKYFDNANIQAADDSDPATVTYLGRLHRTAFQNTGIGAYMLAIAVNGAFTCTSSVPSDCNKIGF